MLSKLFFLVYGLVLVLPCYPASKSSSLSTSERAINFKYFEQRNFSTKFLVLSNHPTIEKIKKQYSTKEGLQYLSKVMQRSLPYRDFILEQLDEYQLPRQLLFLPVIESGFSEKAVSKSGATGIWQFMKNSIQGYDITISEWVDERRDPWKTTIAAVKKLKYNYDQLGDWALALAAYNAGLNAIKQAISKAKVSSFWYLMEHGFLKAETANYVPKFLAITELLLQSQELGIDWGETETAIKTTTIPLKRAVDIRVIENELSIDSGLLHSLNPSLYYSITPPDSHYALRIPFDYEQEVRALLESDKILVNYYIYEIKSGDTLYALSKHYGVSVQTIQSYNGGLNPSALRIGQKIIIPALKQVSPYTRQNEVNFKFTSKYTVKKGDTLWSIAISHNTTVERLSEENNISVSSILNIGTVLLVP